APGAEALTRLRPEAALQGAGADVSRCRPVLETLAAGGGAHQMACDRAGRLPPREHQLDPRGVPHGPGAAEQRVQREGLPASGAQPVDGRLRGASGEHVDLRVTCGDSRLPETVHASRGGHDSRLPYRVGTDMA